MKSLIAVGLLLAASGATSVEPWRVFGQAGSEVLLLLVWGTTLLLAGHRVRARSAAESLATPALAHPQIAARAGLGRRF